MSVRTCDTPNCDKEAKLQCPTCIKLNLEPSFFCSQECFKKTWNTHKQQHQKQNDVTSVYMPWPSFTFTGILRPYPVTPMRTVPSNIQRPDYADHPEGFPASERSLRGSTNIETLNEEEQECLRIVCKLGREVLEEAAKQVGVGVTAEEIDRVVHEACIERECYPSPLNYYNFPKSCCTSVNEVICHGIPDLRPLKDGDILNIDISTFHRGFHGDLNETFFVGDVDEKAKTLVRVTHECLQKAIGIVKPGVKYREVGDVIQKHAQSHGFSVVRSYCGHGIHRLFHAAPSIPHYAKNKAIGIMKPGHTFTIEPMISEGTWKDKTWPDDWTSVTVDGKLSAQFEQTLLVTDTGCDILTKRISIQYQIILIEMDVNVGRYNDKMKDFMPYQSHFRHSEAKHFFDRFHPQASHAPNLFKPYYFHTGNKWNAMMNANSFIPCMYSEPNLTRCPPPSKQRFTNQNENNVVKASNKSENVVPATLKEKTPMCLVNEIARFNKIDQKYILTNEEGPAHKKTFFVTLKLGDETFSSSGQSIKKARHSAAIEALKNTKHKKPPVKSAPPPSGEDPEDANPSMTPTVELNSIAMKKGEVVCYEVIGGFKSSKPVVGDVVDCSRGHNPAFVVKLSMGGRQYFGEGYSVQRARHSAATKAINTFKGGSPDDDAVKELQKEVPSTHEDHPPAPDNKGSSCRSEVSRVHEIAFKKKFKTTFNVTSESGPAHMRTYVTTCECGTFRTTGEGNSKKISKQKAAEKMLEELNSLSPLPQATYKPPNRFKSSKVEHSKAVDRTFHKVLKANPDYGAGINAVSRLIQIQQAKKLAEPSFLLLEERGSSRDKEFHVQVTVGDKTCSSWASNKKLAKRNAAEKMLQLLGYSRNSNQATSGKKVTFSDVNNVAELMGLLDVKEGNQEMKQNELLTPSSDACVLLASFEAI